MSAALQNIPTYIIEPIKDVAKNISETFFHYAQNDKQFQEQLGIVKQSFDNDPLRDTPGDEVKLDALVLKHGIKYVVEETKKRYTV